MKKLFIPILVLILIGIGLLVWSQNDTNVAFGDPTNFDAIGTEEFKVGTDCNEFSAFSTCQGLSVGVNGTLTQGGGVTATSSAASATIQAADFNTENIIEVSLPVGSVTLTFPASTTFPLGTKTGSWREFAIFNASTTAGQVITIAGGTGTLLEVASSTLSAGLKEIQPSGVALFTAFRKANSDIEVFMNPGQ